MVDCVTIYLNVFTEHLLEHYKDPCLNMIEMRQSFRFSVGVQVLYHSNLGFQNRLYGSFGPDLLCIKLHEPLSIIMKQPRLYVRDLVPSLAFQGLYKINMVE